MDSFKAVSLDKATPTEAGGRHKMWAAAAAGLILISAPAAILAAPASAKPQALQGTNKKLTKAEAKKWVSDLQYGAAQVGVYCTSKGIQKFSPITKIPADAVWAFSGANPCKIASVLAITAGDLRLKAAQRPYFAFTVEHKARRLRPDTCLARLTVVNTTRTFSFPAKGGSC